MKVKITADSICDLPVDLVSRYDISIVPLSVVMDGAAKKDGIEITPEDIYSYVETTGKTCTTAAVNVADYQELFGRCLQEYEGIVHFTISSEMSACYQNAVIAAEEFENIHVVDTRNLSTGAGHLVLDAAIMAQQGIAAAEIKAAMEAKKEKVDASFVIDTLLYLHKGGRCSAVAALGANLLSLKPCIEVRNGVMGVSKKYRGALNKCLIKYVEDRLKDKDDIDYSRVFVTHSGMKQEWIDEVVDCVKKYAPFEEVIIARAGCTISNHCGPNTLGILYYRK